MNEWAKWTRKTKAIVHKLECKCCTADRPTAVKLFTFPNSFHCRHISSCWIVYGVSIPFVQRNQPNASVSSHMQSENISFVRSVRFCTFVFAHWFLSRKTVSLEPLFAPYRPASIVLGCGTCRTRAGDAHQLHQVDSLRIFINKYWYCVL